MERMEEVMGELLTMVEVSKVNRKTERVAKTTLHYIETENPDHIKPIEKKGS